MPSDPQSSEVALDDEAIKMLFHYAGWECRWEELDQEWHVRPPRENFMGYATFVTLSDALEYMLMFKRLESLQQ